MTLKEMRKHAGYSQVELAEKSGINLRSLQDYEQGHKAISSAKGETLYRLSYVLGYSIEDILLDSCAHLTIEKENTKAMNERIRAYERALKKRNDSLVHFPVIVEDILIDMSRIYPTKQRMVKMVIEELRGDKRISFVRLFGSSITMRCNKESDLDFAICLVEQTNEIKNDISEKVQECCEWMADIIWMDHILPEERIYQDIMKGLVIV